MPKKYKQGAPIRTLEQFAHQQFVMWKGKVYHYGWAQSWSFRVVRTSILRGELFTVDLADTNSIKPEGEMK